MGFLGFGGNAKTNRGMGMSESIFNYALPLAKDLRTQGQGSIDSAMGSIQSLKDFFQKILSGNTASVNNAVAPEVNQMNAAGDAARTSQAVFGTARGGGAASDMVSAETNKLKSINDAVFGARPSAAQNIGQLSQLEAGIGQNEIMEALQSLGLSAEAASHYTQTALKQKEQNTQAWRDLLSFAFPQRRI